MCKVTERNKKTVRFLQCVAWTIKLILKKIFTISTVSKRTSKISVTNSVSDQVKNVVTVSSSFPELWDWATQWSGQRLAVYTSENNRCYFSLLGWIFFNFMSQWFYPTRHLFETLWCNVVAKISFSVVTVTFDLWPPNSDESIHEPKSTFVPNSLSASSSNHKNWRLKTQKHNASRPQLLPAGGIKS